MRGLSISLAWEQTKSCIAADGRLFATVAAALIVLPVAVLNVVSPGGIPLEDSASPWLLVLPFLVIALLLLAQLALIRLAIGPSVSVGEAIVHGLKRFPIYFAANLLVGIALFIFILICATALLGAGVSMSESRVQLSPAVIVVAIAILAIYCFAWVRFFAMAAPVTCAEAAGPIAIIRRSWELTAGHTWRLLGFLILFLVGASIVILAITWIAGIIAQVLIGPLEPFSGSALLVGLVDSVANGAVLTLLTVMLARIYVQLSGRGFIDVSVPSSGS